MEIEGTLHEHLIHERGRGGGATSSGDSATSIPFWIPSRERRTESSAFSSTCSRRAVRALPRAVGWRVSRDQSAGLGSVVVPGFRRNVLSMQVLRRGCRDSGKISGEETPCSSVVAQEREFSFGPSGKRRVSGFCAFLLNFFFSASATWPIAPWRAKCVITC